MRLGREYREAQFVKDVEWEVHSTWKSVKVISDASHDQIWQELKQIQQVLVGMLGRPSRWSGIVELTEDPYIRGAKPFRCDIIINAELSEKDLRWRTLIHEMLHTFSAGYQPLDYASFRGWEEGIVEQLQRVLRPAVLAELGLAIAEKLFETVEQEHDYAEYVQALENMREALQVTSLVFYKGLLATPIRDRRRSVFEQGMALPFEERFLFLSAYSTGDAILRTGVKQ